MVAIPRAHVFKIQENMQQEKQIKDRKPMCAVTVKEWNLKTTPQTVVNNKVYQVRRIDTRYYSYYSVMVTAEAVNEDQKKFTWNTVEYDYQECKVIPDFR